MQRLALLLLLLTLLTACSGAERIPPAPTYPCGQCTANTMGITMSFAGEIRSARLHAITASVYIICKCAIKLPTLI